jgi:hypothetical protein
MYYNNVMCMLLENCEYNPLGWSHFLLCVYIVMVMIQ